MNADGYTVDEDGYFKKVNNEGRDSNGKNQYDVIYAKSEYSNNNKKDYDESGNKTGLKVSDGIIESKETVAHIQPVDPEGYPNGDKTPVEKLDIKSDTEAQAIHKFLDKKTNVEWSNMYAENNQGDSKNIMITSHLNGKVHSSMGSRLLFNSKYRKNFRKDHNHPNNDTESSPSDRSSAKIDRDNFTGATHRILVDGEYHPYK